MIRKWREMREHLMVLVIGAAAAAFVYLTIAASHSLQGGASCTIPW